MEAGSGEEPITDAEVTAFAKKLEDWGSQLPQGEQALLRLLLSAAQDTSPDDVVGYALSTSIGDAATTSLTSMLGGSTLTVSGRIGWLKESGPSWLRSTPPLSLP
jgi:hypothetical protein